jgi:hypothetical protein
MNALGSNCFHVVVLQACDNPGFEKNLLLFFLGRYSEQPSFTALSTEMPPDSGGWLLFLGFGS